MKTLEVVIKMAFPQRFCKMVAKTQFLEIILKFYLTKRKNGFGKLNHISFITWAVVKNPKFRVFGVSLACKKFEHLNFGC